MNVKTSISTIALLAALAAAPAMAQDTGTESDGETSILDTIIDLVTPNDVTPPEGDGTDAEEDGEPEDSPEADGNFNRDIPEGIKGRLSEEEILEYEKRLQAAETPQERNAIRSEIQRLNMDRHQDEITARKQAKEEEKKGFFEGLFGGDSKGKGKGQGKNGDSDVDGDDAGKGNSGNSGNGGGRDKDRGGKDKGGKK